MPHHQALHPLHYRQGRGLLCHACLRVRDRSRGRPLELPPRHRAQALCRARKPRAPDQHERPGRARLAARGPICCASAHVRPRRAALCAVACDASAPTCTRAPCAACTSCAAERVERVKDHAACDSFHIRPPCAACASCAAERVKDRAAYESFYTRAHLKRAAQLERASHLKRAAQHQAAGAWTSAAGASARHACAGPCVHAKDRTHLERAGYRAASEVQTCSGTWTYRALFYPYVCSQL